MTDTQWGYNILCMTRDTTKRAIHRIKIIKGQLDGLEKRIAEDASCIDIVTQSLSIQKSLASLSKLMVEQHVATETVEMLTAGDKKQQERALKELSQLYDLTTVRGK